MMRPGSLLAVGRTSDVFHCGPGAVVKVPRPAVPGHWARQEAAFTAAVRELGAPAPAVLEVVQVDGRDAIVFERVEGPSMWELIVEEARPPAAFGQELADVHGSILRAGLPLEVPALVERMTTKVAELKQLAADERAEAQRALEGLPRGAALLHGDLHPGNVLMSPSGPVAIDWFDAAVGHPVADVVRSSLLIRPFDHSAERPHLPRMAPPVLRALHESYLGAMGDVLAGCPEELHRWEAVVAVSRLAEEAEADDSSLLALWRGRHTPRSATWPG
ncbi:phosphotransferase enzyme family protein [Candidatus Poriferisocius sp.]|uniref:phosphotransferase enzyme family protein n=1 Tax=Candidatus Poriferisocius sp. TaxID=3101276 RepID=UPI003B5CBB72